MEDLIEKFDEIDTCLVCSKPIRVVKLKYIKNKMINISNEDLINFKFCSMCKRTIIAKMEVNL